MADFNFGRTDARAHQGAFGGVPPHTNDRLAGPGWFDSSWDLRRGLEVSEGLPGDVQPNEWLALYASG